MGYPLRIRITDPDLINIFKCVSRKRFTSVSPSYAKIIGRKIPRSVKRDGVIIDRGNFAICNPDIVLDFCPAYGKRKGYDFFFKKEVF